MGPRDWAGCQAESLKAASDQWAAGWADDRQEVSEMRSAGASTPKEAGMIFAASTSP